MLNSVLMEGFLVKPVEMAKDSVGCVMCKFEIKNLITGDDENLHNTQNFQVFAYGELAEFLEDNETGQSLRVVGRLSMRTHGAVIIAEHVDVRGKPV